MRTLDHALQRWRIARAVPWIRDGDRLLDVGCHDRVLIDQVRDRVAHATGVDPLVEPSEDGNVRLVQGIFPDAVSTGPAAFDCITTLAVLEHVADPDAFARACAQVLAPGGRVVLTVPHPFVDVILDALIALRLADGMAAEDHHGFESAQTPAIFEAAGFRCLARRRFQLGLNQLFVFELPRF